MQAVAAAFLFLPISILSGRPLGEYRQRTYFRVLPPWDRQESLSSGSRHGRSRASRTSNDYTTAASCQALSPASGNQVGQSVEEGHPSRKLGLSGAVKLGRRLHRLIGQFRQQLDL